ncbi:unnamed protein product [Peniophora sp. CBMAI 1063]|nr:unnamed protein product [Peniophora sp. CBMAI 1063]
MSGSKEGVLRGPGPLESTALHLHSLGFYTAVCSVARFTRPGWASEYTMEIPEYELLYMALHLVIAQHPPLAVTIMNESPTSSARFVRLPSIDLEDMVSYRPYPRGSDDEVVRQRVLNDVIERRLSSRFADLVKLPPWRVVSLHPSYDAREYRQKENYMDIALFIHPAIADGISAVVFMGALLAALNSASKLTRFDYPGKIVTPPQSTLLPPLERIRRLPVSYFALVKEMWRRRFLPSRGGLWTARPVSRPPRNEPVDTSLPAVHTRHATRFFSAEKVKNLVAACHGHQTTLTPLLEALIARAFFAVLPVDGSADRLTAICPINLRPYLPGEHKETMGFYISAGQHEFKRESADVWEEAKRAERSLVRVLDGMKRGRHFHVGTLQCIRDTRGYLEEIIDKPRAHSFELSNIGAVDGQFDRDSGPYALSRMLFTQSACVVGAAVKFGVVTVSGGTMGVSASWAEEVVEDGVVEGILEKLTDLVDGVCSGKL